MPKEPKVEAVKETLPAPIQGRFEVIRDNLRSRLDNAATRQLEAIEELARIEDENADLIEFAVSQSKKKQKGLISYLDQQGWANEDESEQTN